MDHPTSSIGAATGPVCREAADLGSLEIVGDAAITDREVLSICEHFSHRPLSSLDCLWLKPGEQARGVRQSPFSRCVIGQIPEVETWDEVFDLIICDHGCLVTHDLRQVADRIFRLLKPDGMCHFSGRRKYFWSKASGEPGRVRHRSLRFIRRCLVDFWIHDYHELIRQYPEVFQRDHGRRSRLGSMLYELFSGDGEFVWMLTKKR